MGLHVRSFPIKTIQTLLMKSINFFQKNQVLASAKKLKKEKKMNSMNIYVPKFVPKDLPWYERDGLITQYDQMKCKDFLRNTNNHFREAKIVNFDIIHRQCHGEEVPKHFLKQYQTVDDKSILEQSTSDQDKILSNAFHTDRKDIFLRNKP